VHVNGSSSISTRPPPVSAGRASERPSRQALEIGFLGLERRRLEGAIRIAAEQDDFERQSELSLERNRITETIARHQFEEQAAKDRS
jgi:hypothetical protein